MINPLFNFVMRWEAVFWDFDGVILDSVNIKTEAFAQMFHDYGDKVEKAVVDFHLKHGGISRFEKFRYYYNNLLKIPVTEEELSKLGDQFSDLVMQKVIESPFIPGAKENLEKLKAEGVPSYIVSGTPDEEIKQIVKIKLLDKYFEEVHGSPRKKDEIVSEIIRIKKLKKHNCLYIGDASTDYETATNNDIFFIGIVPHGHRSPFPSNVQTSSFVKIPL